jgi:hypothetical protein
LWDCVLGRATGRTALRRLRLIELDVIHDLDASRDSLEELEQAPVRGNIKFAHQR